MPHVTRATGARKGHALRYQGLAVRCLGRCHTMLGHLQSQELTRETFPPQPHGEESTPGAGAESEACPCPDIARAVPGFAF
eukprot:7384192-Pyramimonas_sp.AAC.1